MAKYRGRQIAGVSIANPRCIMKKVARARAYASLHCRDGLKDESMKTPRSKVHIYTFILFRLLEERPLRWPGFGHPFVGRNLWSLKNEVVMGTGTLDS